MAILALLRLQDNLDWLVTPAPPGLLVIQGMLVCQDLWATQEQLVLRDRQEHKVLKDRRASPVLKVSREYLEQRAVRVLPETLGHLVVLDLEDPQDQLEQQGYQVDQVYRDLSVIQG